MGRYILRYGNASSAPEEHVQTIAAMDGVRVLDKSPNMLLVDADEAALRLKIGDMEGWSVHPEKQVPLPDSRNRIA